MHQQIWVRDWINGSQFKMHHPPFHPWPLVSNVLFWYTNERFQFFLIWKSVHHKSQNRQLVPSMWNKCLFSWAGSSIFLYSYYRTPIFYLFSSQHFFGAQKWAVWPMIASYISHWWCNASWFDLTGPQGAGNDSLLPSLAELSVPSQICPRAFTVSTN